MVYEMGVTASESCVSFRVVVPSVFATRELVNSLLVSDLRNDVRSIIKFRRNAGRLRVRKRRIRNNTIESNSAGILQL
jgi:hypothetical protein